MEKGDVIRNIFGNLLVYVGGGEFMYLTGVKSLGSKEFYRGTFAISPEPLIDSVVLFNLGDVAAEALNNGT